MGDAIAPPTFAGFPEATFDWFDGLQDDNSKRYFTEHRATFDESVRGALEAMLDELAEEFGGQVKVFRQHRDVRFSPDKSPYKTRTYGIIGERPGSAASLYAGISAAGLFAGTGYYVLASDQLARFREAVADDGTGPELERAMALAVDAGLEVYGEALKTAPRGHPRDHPRIKLLRHRSAIAGGLLESGRNGIDRDAALAHAHDAWVACEPLNRWLALHVGPSELEASGRFPRPGARG
jgi:uncharacterized protein (TIGR02453 family)